jgi:ribosome recycling factor
MDEEVQLYLDDAKERMQKVIIHLENELIKIRAGKANPQMLEGIKVDYYGNITPLAQVANINTPDARTIIVQPWEKNMVEPINKAILASNIGLTPIPSADMVRLSIPPLTEERRKSLVKQLHGEGEKGKISLRNIRRELLEEIKKLEKEGLPEDVVKETEETIQKVTDDYSKKIDFLLEKKEKDIMTV